MDIVSIGIAILPSVILGLILYFYDKYERENIFHLLLAFSLGTVATIPILSIEEMFNYEPPYVGATIYALTEEILKFIILMLFIYPRHFFDEPYDGIIYASYISLGFATVENIMYVYKYGVMTGILRMFTAVPAHVVFGIAMGFYTGSAKFSKENKIRIKNIIIALLLPILLHWLYDYFLIQEFNKLLIIFSFILIIIGIILGKRGIIVHLENSPFKNSENS